MSCIRKSCGVLPLAVLLTLSFVAASAPLLAQTNTYTGATSAVWSLDGNWSLALEPTAADDVVLPSVIPGTGSTITLSAGELANSLSFLNSYILTGGDLTLTSGNINVDPTFTGTISSNLLGTAGLTKNGAGTLVLGGVNTFTGSINLSAGTLSISDNANLGTATNGIVFTGSSTLAVTGATAVTANRTVSVGAGLVGTVDVAAGQTFRVDGVVSGAGTLLKSGTGTLVLGNTANTISTITMSSGLLLAEGNGSLGNASSTFNFNGGTLATDDITANSYTVGTLNIGGNVQFGNTTLGFTGPQTFSGTAVNLGGATRTLTLDEEVIFTGVVSNGAIIKAGDDFIQFNNSGNTFTSYTHQSSTVRLGGDNVLGTGLVSFTTNNDVVIQSSSSTARLLDNDLSISVNVDYGSTGAQNGALTFTGDVNLNAGTRTFEIFNTAANFVTFTGVISNGGVTKSGQGTLVLEGVNTYTGNTTITTGQIFVRGGGKIVSPLITIGDYNGFDESMVIGANTDTVTSGSLDHIADTTEIELRGQVPLTFNGPNEGDVLNSENTEVIGILDIRESMPTIVLNPVAGGTMQVTASQFHRNSAAITATSNTTLVLRGTGLGGTGANSSRLVLTSAPATVGLGGTGASASIIPWILGSTSTTAAPENFVRYDAVTGVTPLDPGTDYATDFSSPLNLGKNFTTAGGTTLTSNYSVNALRLTGGTTTISGLLNRLDLGTTVHTGGAAFTGAGALLFTDDATIAGTGRLAFGAQRGYIWLSKDTTALTAAINTTIAGTGGIIMSETGTANNVLVLGADNTFTGGFIINSGIVRMGNAGAFNDNYFNAVVLRVGAGTSLVPTLQLNGFNLSILTTADNFMDRNSIIENGGATDVTLTLTGTTTSNSNDGILQNGTGGGILSLHKRGTNTVQFTANNTFTGSVTISEGTLQLIGNGVGRMLNASSYNIMSGGRFLLSSPDTNNDDADRVSNTAAVNMQGGTFEYDHGTAASISENAGPLNILAGYNTVTNDSAGSNVSNLAFDNLSRPNMGAVVDFQGASLGTGDLNRISFDTAPILNDGIIGGWAFWSNAVGTAGADFATYGIAAGSNNSVKQFTAYNTAASGAAWGTTINSAPTADVTLNIADGATRVVNSLKLADGIDLNLGTVALNVDTGGVIALGATAKTISNGTITAGNAANTDLILNVGSGNVTTISAQIIDNGVGAVGFTKVGAGQVTLSNTNTYTGKTAILGGILNFTSDANLGTAPGASTAGHLQLNGGTLNLAAVAGTVALNSNRGIELGGSAGSATNVIQSTAGATLTYGGFISSVGNAHLTLAGDVDFTLSAGSVVGGTWQVSGVATGSADVILGGASNTVGYSLNVGRDGSGTATMTYAQTGGSLSVGMSSPNTSNLDIGVRTSSSANATSGTLNLAGSGNFAANVDRFRIGSVTNAGGNGTATGSVTLAATNVIHAGTEVLLGDSASSSTSNNPTATLVLGTSNTIVTPLMTVGGRRGSGGSTVSFGSTGNLTLYGQGGTTDLRIAYNNQNASSNSSGTMDLTGGTFTADLGVLTIGLKGIATDSSTGGATGLLALGSGANEVRANSVVLGQMMSASGTIVAGSIAQGTLTMAGGTFDVAGDLSMGLWQDNSGSDGTSKGILTLTGGSMTIRGDIVKTDSVRSAAMIEVNGATASLNVLGGSMNASQLAFRNGAVTGAGLQIILDAAGVTNGITFAALDHALILRDVSLTAGVTLTNATANKGGILYEAASGGAGGTLSGAVDLGTVTRVIQVEDSVAASNDLTISGAVSGASVVKEGAGTLLLSGSNTYTGDTTVNAGVLKAGSSTAFGNTNSLMTVAVGASLNTNGQSVTVGALTGGGTVQNAAATNGLLNFGGNNADTTFTGTITDGIGGGRLSLTKSGTGIATLSGTNSYTGATVVNGGILRGGLTGTSSINISGTGALELTDNTGIVLNLSGTAGALTLTSGARLGLELGSMANYDRIIVSAGGTAITGGSILLDIYGLAGFGTGTYNLLAADSGLAAANYILNAAPAGFNYTINKTDSLVQLIVAALTTRYWTGDQSTSWATNNAGNTNWSNTADGLTETGAVPGPGDAVIFSATNAPFTGGNSITTTLDAAITIDSLQFIGAPLGVSAVTINAGTGGSLTLAPSSSANGISVTSNAGVITIAAPITLGAAQTWTVDGGGFLIVSGNVNYANALTKAGLGTLTLTGNNTGAGGLTLMGGTLNLNSATALGTGTFVINQGTTLDNTSAGALTLTTNNAQSWDGNFTFTGSQNLNLGTGAVTLTNNAGVTTTAGTLTVGGVIGDGASDFTLTKSGDGTLILNGNNTFSGGYVFDGGITVMGHRNALGVADFILSSNSTLQAALDLSSAGSGPVSNNGTLNATLTVDGSNALELSGNFGGTGGLAKSGTGTLTLSGVSTYAGSTLLSQGTLKAAVDNTLPTGTVLFLGSTTAGTPGNNAVNLDLSTNGVTVAGLNVFINAAAASNITIGSGETFRVNGNVTIGPNQAANTVTNVVVSGGGAFEVVNSGGTFLVGGSVQTTFGNSATLNMAGLASFTADLGATGTFRIGDSADTAGSGVGSSTVILATTSTITANVLAMDGAHGFTAGGFTQTLRFGNGNGTIDLNGNITSGGTLINANTLTLGAGTAGRSSVVVTFDHATDGTLRVRAANGTGRAAVTLVSGGSSTGANWTGTVNLDGHHVDLLLSTLNIAGRGANTGSATGTFQMDTGKMDVTGVTVGSRSGTASGAVNGTLDIGGGTVIVGATGISVAANTSTTTTSSVTGSVLISGGTTTVGATSGTSITLGNSSTAGSVTNASLVITGGSVTLAGDIIEGTGAGNASVTSTLTLEGGTLDMGGNDIGNATQTINNLNFRSGTLRRVASINGTAALNKTTTGVLTIEDVNAYSGGTNVNDGTVHLNNASLTGTGAVVVNKTAPLATTAVLSGTGSIAGTVTVGSTTVGDSGILRPGDNLGAGNGTLTITSPGGLDVKTGSQIQLSISSATLNSTGFKASGMTALDYLNANAGEVAVWNTAPSNASNHDYINLSGSLSTLSIGDRASVAYGDGSVVVSLGAGFTTTFGDVYNLVDWLSLANITGGFDTGGLTLYDASGNVIAGDLDLPTLGAGMAWDVSAFTKYGVVVVVPEPGRAMLLFLGVMSLVMRRRRARR